MLLIGAIRYCWL